MSLGSPLGAIASSGKARAAWEVARAAYHERGVPLIRPEWLPTQEDRDQLIALADKAFGERRVAG